MIDRYINNAEKESIKRRYNISDDFEFHSTFNANPTHKLPVIFNEKPLSVKRIFWGQTPEWSNNKKLSIKLYNSSVTESKTKRSLAIGLENRRCLVPATGFVIWNKLGKKTAVPYLYHLPEFQLFSIAGVWEEFSNIDGNGYLIFKTLTRIDESLKIVAPVIPNEVDELDWLSGQKETDSILQNEKYNFIAYSISQVLHKSQIDNEEMIKHIPPVDQQGNYTLFS